jgi:hypothetical protein
MAESPEASSSATWTVPVYFWACTPISTLTICRQRFLDGRGVIESVLRPEGSLDSGNGPKSGVAPWLRKTGKRRSRLRLCARERRRSARERRDARSARRPRPQAPVPKCPGGSARKSGHPPSPVKHGPSIGFDLPEKIERAILMQNQEAGIASPQVAATVQSNHQCHQTSEIVQHRPCVTQRQFWQGPPHRNVWAWRRRPQRSRDP